MKPSHELQITQSKLLNLQRICNLSKLTQHISGKRGIRSQVFGSKVTLSLHIAHSFLSKHPGL